MSFRRIFDSFCWISCLASKLLFQTSIKLNLEQGHYTQKYLDKWTNLIMYFIFSTCKNPVFSEKNAILNLTVVELIAFCIKSRNVFQVFWPHTGWSMLFSKPTGCPKIKYLNLMLYENQISFLKTVFKGTYG